MTDVIRMTRVDELTESEQRDMDMMGVTERDGKEITFVAQDDFSITYAYDDPDGDLVGFNDGFTYQTVDFWEDVEALVEKFDAYELANAYVDMTVYEVSKPRKFKRALERIIAKYS